MAWKESATNLAAAERRLNKEICVGGITTRQMYPRVVLTATQCTDDPANRHHTENVLFSSAFISLSLSGKSM
jgi:hypothetical protein